MLHSGIKTPGRVSLLAFIPAAITAVIVCVAPIAGVGTFAADNGENGTARKKYDRALALWTRSAITDYTMKVRFDAFSPRSGEWTITVRHGTLTRWSYRNSENDPKYRAFALKLTVDALFEKAAGSFGNRNDSPVRMFADYDKADGHVTLVMRKPGTTGTRSAPRDTSYRYQVISFRKLDPGEKEM